MGQPFGATPLICSRAPGQRVHRNQVDQGLLDRRTGRRPVPEIGGDRCRLQIFAASISK